MMNILFFIFCLVISDVYNVDGIQDILKEDVKFEIKQNLTINSSIKTIHTKFGNIVDCVDIYKQPAFDHPLLKDHKLQQKPSFEIEKTTENSSQIEFMFEFDEENCPEGTVPVLRTNENLLSNDHMLSKEIPGVHLAEVSLKPHFGPYYKVSGTVSIYNPQVNKSQISLAHIWVERGVSDTTNKISAGWHVDPGLYNDYGTHFYSTWTSDNFEKTGCTNLKCQGFVQTSTNVYLGARFPRLSVYGVASYVIHVSITQDPETKNWWLTLGKKNIGYFPAKLFNNLGSAAIVGWGGRTKANIGSPSPPMGSGHFPDGHSLHSCYFRSVLAQDSSKNIYGPKPDETKSFTDNDKCYGVKYFGDQGENLGSVLQFGGPGGICGN
ncbi:uncharacterized protein LOC124824537 [Vigna umbellata]|uniref:uncharacterized protein LOC124824537 n=1 Tax=Vigna umbellata TaxID=87088 RepID=UPI001F5FB8C0|nr:uncharacterized protein LOC124824537 [Vigna umbellata]